MPASTPVLNYLITTVCLIGLGLSIYAYTIHLNLEKNKNYEAACDINQHISCTKTIKSEFGKGLGIVGKDSWFYKPNSLLGILYYSLVATIASSNSIFITRLAYWFTFFSNILSLYFAYILYFKLQDFCIVCVATYIVNILTIILENYKLRSLMKQQQQERTSGKKHN